MFTRIPETVQTLYAELLDQLRQLESPLGTMPQGGSFVSKSIRGARYWYQQTMEGERKRQKYLGRETPELIEAMDQAKERRHAESDDIKRRRELVAMLRTGGMAHEPAPIAAVVRILARAGVFHLGGVLVGTQAFSCHANMLGIRFEMQSLRTADVDVAQDASIALAVSEEPPVQILEELRREEPRFVAVPGFSQREPSTSFKVRGRDLRVDFLTPMIANRTRPVFLRHLGVAAQPLAGLDYLIETTVDAAVLANSGVLVLVPQPGRFALHKLWLASQRPASDQAKARKDLRQAEQLLDALAMDRPADIDEAFAALASRARMANSVRKALGKIAGDVRDRVVATVPSLK
ncbi:MAG TPA: GSU2403 family nucleotidyltransferase fold protein [Thermoanaerobaculia bacterium]|nr:GSU2403 family nucleotidyltransferase fold protein [Thermoanaerobaculia bacterium]